MKIRIEFDEGIEENEVVIKCNNLDLEVQKIQEMLSGFISKKASLEFYKEGKDFYLSLDNILFFETENSEVNSHTYNDIYKVKQKLYELENILPREFVRVSKSTIININHVHAITKNITSASLIEFQDTYKTVYASRHYYRELKLKLGEKRG